MMKPKEDGGLGFRDIYEFNLAMLARQGWRLLQAPNSLCARVLKALYFADGDVLSAGPMPGMSYVWRSILKGIQVLKLGIIWRVGDRNNIRIWEDPWIPDSSTVAQARSLGTTRSSGLHSSSIQPIMFGTTSW
jgi:hypothetical protein